MKLTLKQTEDAYSLLRNYKGTNPYIISLKNNILVYKKDTLSDFNADYLLKNADKEPYLLDKIIKISAWYGEKKQTDWNLEFTPKVLYISYILGETDDYYHAYVKYRKSQEKLVQLFIPKKEILTPLFVDSWEDKIIDFDKYNSLGNITIRPHQERGIKFLSTRKKCILSTQMGGGKTLQSIVAALECVYKKVLIVCPASLKTNWQNEILRFVKQDEITIVNGSTWKDNKFTIINYDILKNFYVVPKETRKVKQKDYTDDGQIKWSTVEKVVKTNKSEIVSAALDNSQLFQSQFDLIIIDEAHRLSNKTSGIYEIMEDLIKRSKPQGIFELTGTMIKNDAANLYNLLKLIGADITQDWVKYHTLYCGAKQIFKNRKERDYHTNIFLKAHNKNEWKDLSYLEKQDLNDYLAKNCKKIWIMGEADENNLKELSERIKHLYYRELNEEVLNSINIEKKVIEYDLTSEEKLNYNNAWTDYINTHEETDIDKLIQNHKLIEGSVFRQILADCMVSRTIQLAEQEIENGNKIVIFCCFDKELYTLQEYFGDRCVIYNGKMTAKKKDEALLHFKTEPSCKVFIGNLASASVGLNINEANVLIFNNVDFVPAVNEQAEFRIIRLGKTDDVKIYYQKFNDTYMDRLFTILDIKNNIINTVITDEKNK